jgi:hypothetical protein
VAPLGEGEITCGEVLLVHALGIDAEAPKQRERISEGHALTLLASQFTNTIQDNIDRLIDNSELILRILEETNGQKPSPSPDPFVQIFAPDDRRGYFSIGPLCRG